MKFTQTVIKISKKEKNEYKVMFVNPNKKIVKIKDSRFLPN